MPDAFDRCILDLSGIATFDTHKITRYTGISVVEAALLRLTRDFIVANGEHENFRPRLESEREKIIRLGQCEKNTPLVECGRKGKKKNAGWYCEYRVGRKKKCISSIFVPVCSLMEVVGMLKNMREKGYSERFFYMIVILDIIWKFAKFGRKCSKEFLKWKWIRGYFCDQMEKSCIVVLLIFEIYFEVNFNEINYYTKFDTDFLTDSYLFLSNFVSRIHLSD